MNKNLTIFYALVATLPIRVIAMDVPVQVQGNQSTPLHKAVERGTVEEVTKLLNRNADVNAKNMTGATPLHAAAVRGNVEMCTVLIEYGADCNEMSNSRNSPLHLAALRGHLSVCVVLVQSGADLTLKNGAGQTPLQLAQENQHTSLYAILTSHEQSSPDEAGVTPSAPSWNDIPEFQEPPKNANYRSNESSNQRSSVEFSHKKTTIPDAPVQQVSIASGGIYPSLFDPFATEQTYGSSPFAAAVAPQQSEKKQHITAHVTDQRAKADDWTVLHQAASEGKVDEVKRLLLSGTKVDVEDNKGRTALHIAAEFGMDAVVEVLIEYKATIQAKDNELGIMPLHLAAKNGHGRVMSILIFNGADTNAIDKDGRTPLHMALNKEVVNILLAHKANVLLEDKEGIIPFYSATRAGNKEVVKCLMLNHGFEDKKVYVISISYSKKYFYISEEAIKGKVTGILSGAACFGATADVFNMLIALGAANPGWESLLFLAAMHGRTEVIEFIWAQSGFDAKRCDEYGYSLMHYAAISGSINTVKLLLAHGAEINAQAKGANSADCHHGVTPLHIAVLAQDKEIVQYLLQHGADTKAKCAYHGYNFLGGDLKKNALQIAEARRDEAKKGLRQKGTYEDVVEILRAAEQKK